MLRGVRAVLSRYSAALLFGLATWFIGFGLGPLLHLLQHEADHVHLPDGGILYVDRSAPAAPEPGDREPLGPEPPAHGQGGLSHFGAAHLVSPAPPLALSAPSPAPVEPGAMEPSEPRRPRWAAPRPSRDPPPLA